eukprot:TRINITY_DN647_c0_g1_i2.p1 TRINITY_DN647_c0_g1~~TRINITY_DN647_c0_g1_i2.p1  ORF type:complete len:111 (-),score=15.88 TRINITY_DN647_c0_g1_i2:314-646(-)
MLLLLLWTKGEMQVFQRWIEQIVTLVCFAYQSALAVEIGVKLTQLQVIVCQKMRNLLGYHVGNKPQQKPVIDGSLYLKQPHSNNGSQRLLSLQVMNSGLNTCGQEAKECF